MLGICNSIAGHIFQSALVLGIEPEYSHSRSSMRVLSAAGGLKGHARSDSSKMQYVVIYSGQAISAALRFVKPILSSTDP